MYYFIFLLTFCMLPNLSPSQGFGINLIKVPDDDRSQVMCSMALLRKYFKSGDPLSGSVLYMSLTSASMHTQKRLLDAIHGMPDYPWTIVIRDAKIFKSGNQPSSAVLHEKPQSYFLVLENLEDDDLEDIFEDWKTTLNWNPLAQFVVYLASVEETDEEMTELMIEILLSFMNKKIYNVNVIGQNEENGYYYGKTVFPYHPDNNCGNRVISIETLDICDYQEEENTGDDDDDGDGNDGEDEEGRNVENDEEDDDGQEDNAKDKGNNDEEENPDEADNDGQDERNKADDGEQEVTQEVGQENEDGIAEVDENNVNEGNEEENGAEDGVEENEPDNIGENNEDATQADENRNDKKEENGAVGSAEEKDSENVPENDVGTAEVDKNGDGQDKENEYADDESEKNYTQEKVHKNDEENAERTAVSDEKVDSDDANGKDTKVKDENRKRFTRNLRVKAEKHFIKIKKNKKFTRSLKNLKTGNKEKIRSSKNRRKRQANKSKRAQSSVEDIDEAQSNNDDFKSNLYLEEIYRALFFDKFPKDLSGCPLVAAYRPWEPYIFPETFSLNFPTVFEDQDFGVNVASNEGGEDWAGNQTAENQFAYGSAENDADDVASTDDPFIDTAYDTVSSESRIPTDSGYKPKLNGIEYQLLQTIGERLHISIDLQVEHRNLYHLFQQLIDGDIEMVIGGIDEDPSISQFVSTTIPYHQDDLTWCVAKAKRSYNLFNFLASFSPLTWFLTFMVAVIASSIIAMMQLLLELPRKIFRGYFDILFRIIGIIFIQPVPLIKLPTPIRLTFATAFFMGLMFINTYQSFLISTLTTPKSAYQISRVEEIYQQRMKIMGSVDNVRHLSKPGEVFKYIREKFQMCYNIEECLVQAAHNERLAVAVSRQHSFYNPRIPRNQLYCFDRNENLYVYLVTMLLPKKFHLLHKINPVIQYVIESGHMQKWARDLDMRRRIKEERHRVHEQAEQSLTLGQVAGSFAFTGVLLAFACLLFILERCVYRLATRRGRRRRLKIVKYLHRKFQQN